MFIIKPIIEKSAQEHLCTLCEVPYLPYTMAYQAELEGELAAICQFELQNNSGYIHHLVTKPGISDHEMMIIMGRTVMNFIDLCEKHTCYASEASANKNLLCALGFKLQENGEYIAHMEGMFSGCSSKHEPK